MRDSRQRTLQYAHIFHQTSYYVLKCEVRKLRYLVVLELSIFITKIVRDAGDLK